MKHITALIVAGLVLASCTFPPVDGGPVDTVDPLDPIVITPVDDDPDLGTQGTDYWVAKVRYGDNIAHAGAYEVEVGNGPGQRSEGNAGWRSDGVNSFVLTVGGDGTATLTVSTPVSTTTRSYPVGGASGDFYLWSRIPRGGSVSLTSLKLDGVAELAAPLTFAFEDQETLYVRLALGQYDLSGGATLRGSFIWSWPEDGTFQNETPNITLKISRP